MGGAPERELRADVGELVWQADVELFEHFATSPLAETRRVGDGFAFRTGLEDNTRNGVVCSRIDPAEITETLAWLAEVPAQWLVAEETEPADLRDRLDRAGCRAERTAVYMAARLTDLDLRERADFEIVTIRDPGQLAEVYAGVDPLGDDRGRRERELALQASLGLGDDRPLRYYAAFLDGRPVGIASTFLASSAMLGVDLQVAHAQRRRGIGWALVVHALHEGAAAGRTLALLAPTPATVPFYEELGFTLGRFPPDRGFYTPVSGPR